MIDIVKSLLIGIIQGVTEFLPISSTAHLVILHDLWEFSIIDDLSFDVALHLGSLISLLIFFRKDLVKFIIAFIRSFRKWDWQNDLEQRLSWLIILGCVPAGIIGWLLENIIDQYLRSPWVVAVTLITVGLLFLIVEKYTQKIKDLSQITWLNSLIMGFAQAIALIPGVSRSGITIIAGLSQNFKREDAARFSFLIAIPVILGAGIKKILELSMSNLSTYELMILLIGFFSALISGYLSIKYFLRYLKKKSLNIFAFYRFFLGIVIIILLGFKILS